MKLSPGSAGAINLQPGGTFNLQQIAKRENLKLSAKSKTASKMPVELCHHTLLIYFDATGITGVEMLRRMCLRYIDASHKIVMSRPPNDKLDRHDFLQALPHFQKAFAVLQGKSLRKRRHRLLPCMTSKLHMELS